MFKYLGFTFNKEGNYNDHLKKPSRKRRIAVKKVWGLGERICRNDFVRRWNLLYLVYINKYLVQNVISYGI